MPKTKLSQTDIESIISRTTLDMMIIIAMEALGEDRGLVAKELAALVDRSRTLATVARRRPNLKDYLAKLVDHVLRERDLKRDWARS